MTLDAVLENAMLGRWDALLQRHPEQLNKIHEADAELVPLPGGELLAVTTDTIAEEIASGLYRDPRTIGWMAAVVSLSDLAAVGARPLGLVISATLPARDPDIWQQGIAEGLSQACREMGVFVLGGDTNTAAEPSITSCAVGTVRSGRAVTRMGARPGQKLYASGPLGAGSCQAAAALLGVPSELYAEEDFRPLARIDVADIISEFAGCCMDTSDGLIGTLDQLMRLNAVGFCIDRPTQELLDEKSRAVCAAMGLPPLVMPAGYHGEFELVFTVAQDRGEEFEARCRQRGWEPLQLGEVTAEPVLEFSAGGGRIVDGARIRNLLLETKGDIGVYLKTLVGLVGPTP